MIHGNGPERCNLIKYSIINNIQNISFPGHSSLDRILYDLHCSKLFLSTSESEGTPTSLLEAMAAGLPIVTTPSNDYTWLIDHGVNGFISKSWNLQEVLGYLDLVLSNLPLSTAMSNYNRERAKQHTWSRNAQLVTSLMLAQVRIYDS